MHLGCSQPMGPTMGDLCNPVAGLIDIVQKCEATCENMQHYVSNLPDASARAMQMQLLHDCADICGLTAKFLARNSMFARQAAALCACICMVCGNECARFPDPMSQHCACVCLHCARACQAFAGVGGMGPMDRMM